MRRKHRGFTLVEMTVALAASAMLFLAIIAMTFFTSRSLVMMSNYMDLDQKSRYAVDLIGRDIRNSSALLSYSNGSTIKSLTLTNATDQTITTITFNAADGTVITTQTGQPALTNLTECDQWNFSLYTRAPQSFTNDVSFSSTTTPSQCKMINLDWKCSRQIVGMKLNTESVQTAQIILRNQVTQ
ncbi:MAG: prepilin-type N-terminal cleavage/methylation domain-containing protein [Verrucomicrobiota bacterium]|nr:prepilin-type N-terminal cleavage/methylation domain-containing protein [Verrucomicrobiota bacterium]